MTDHLDQAIMRQLYGMYAALDPPPADLDDRVLFALDLENLDAEVARHSADRVGAGARADEQARTITFDADSRTILVTIAGQADGLVRIDGWLAPGESLLVELRSRDAAAPRTVTADEGGRFVLDGVSRGMAQLVVHPPPGSDLPSVVTPSLRL